MANPPQGATGSGGVGDSVETGEITDNAVTLAKLAHGTGNKFLGFDGSGVPSELDGLIIQSSIPKTSSGFSLNDFYRDTTNKQWHEVYQVQSTSDLGKAFEIGVGDSILFDDFSVYTNDTEFDAVWSHDTSSILDVSSANNQIEFRPDGTTVATNRRSYDTGRNWGTSPFVMRCVVSVDAGTQGTDPDDVVFSVVAGSEANLESAGDYIGVVWFLDGTTNTVSGVVSDEGSGLNADTQVGTAQATTTGTFYVQIVRASETGPVTVQIFSDANYSTSVHGPTTMTAPTSTLTDLQYIGVVIRQQGINDHTLDINLEEIVLYIGASSPPA